MEPFKLEFEYEESPASNNGIGFFITVWFNDVNMKDILDVDEFFKVIDTAGISPLFTCSCGGFGCGGYYVEAIHEKTGIVFKNSYKPLETVAESSIIERFEFTVSWEEIYRMGKQILDLLEEIIAKWPGYLIFSGSYSELDLAERIDCYRETWHRLKAGL